MFFFRDWLQSVQRYGPSAILGYPFDLLRVRRAERLEAFDSLWGTDTGTTAFPWNLPSVKVEDAHPYEAAPAWLIREILSSSLFQPCRFTFLDMGSGKGRALLVAAEFPFRRIVGVELSRELHDIAEKNIKRVRSETQQCTMFSLHCMNAVDYAFEPEPLVLLLFNPFGRETVDRVLKNLSASLIALPREAFVVYINPTGTLRQSAPYLRMIKEGGSWWRPWARYQIYAADRESSQIK